MFTEEHYEAIARVICNARKNLAYPGDDSGIYILDNDLSEMFAADSPSFNPEQFAKLCRGEEVVDMDWDKAETHFKSVLEQYKELVGRHGVNVMFAMTATFDPLLKRFNDGERTQDLYDAMLGVQ